MGHVACSRQTNGHDNILKPFGILNNMTWNVVTNSICMKCSYLSANYVICDVVQHLEGEIYLNNVQEFTLYLKENTSLLQTLTD